MMTYPRAWSLDAAPQPAPVPRFSRTVPDVPDPPPREPGDPAAALAGWLSADEIAAWGSG